MRLANGLEYGCPAEAGGTIRILRMAGGQDKHHRRPSPPGQSMILVTCQGFSELLGGLHSRDAYFVALKTNECPSSYMGDSVSTCTLAKPASPRSLRNSSFQYQRMARSSVTHETRCLSL